MVQRGFKQLIAEANSVIETITVAQALTLVGDPGVQFVDVRETVERQQSGTIQGAVHAPRGFLEFHVDPESPMHNPALSAGKRLVLFCGSGGRSALAAKTLHDMGVKNVCHIGGGFAAWCDGEGPTEI
ncbi:MAG: rhodanese-like domain-containing protein [Proteobacteria bacterium]|nr:rhodanese-like domain-containing protein [Pseudomonadota bacterium]